MHNRLPRKPLLTVAAVTALLLLIPAIAMQLTREVRWSLGDFVVAALLLFGTGVGIVLVMRYVKHARQRAMLIGILALTLALAWAELAVGVFS